ncbi:hypothetical protein U9M48_007498 [Paspalum notatum var. saurae]|uniref:Uncharacterized protein n=1 Tax=Paspalum notatum var. saurae TaxID=547442 RepID=A0AAQ3Q078_PASNO
MSSLDRNRQASGRPAGNIGHLGSSSTFDRISYFGTYVLQDYVACCGRMRLPGVSKVVASVRLLSFVPLACLPFLRHLAGQHSTACLWCRVQGEFPGKKKTGRQAKLLQKYSTAVTVKKEVLMYCKKEGPQRKFSASFNATTGFVKCISDFIPCVGDNGLSSTCLRLSHSDFFPDFTVFLSKSTFQEVLRSSLAQSKTS